MALSGKLRNYLHCFPRIKQYIIDPLNTNCFFYGYSNHEGLEKNQKDFVELFKPVDYKIIKETPELIKQLRDKYYRPEYDQRKAPTTDFNKFIGQYTNLYQVSQLIKNHEEKNNFAYDIIIRSRVDCFYYRTPTEEELQQAFRGDILIPYIWDFDTVSGIGCSDAWAMTNSENFHKYAGILDKFSGYFDNGCLCHHESATGWHIRELKLNRIKCLNHIWFEYPSELSYIQDQNRHNYE